MASAADFEAVRASQLQALLTALARIEADRLALMDGILDRRRDVYARAKALGFKKGELRELRRRSMTLGDDIAGPSARRTQRIVDTELFEVFRAVCLDHPILRGRTSPKTYAQYVSERKQTLTSGLEGDRHT